MLLCSLVLLNKLHAQSYVIEVGKAEYFFDTDPGDGNATAFSISPDAIVSFSETVSTTGLAEGPHLLNVRSQGKDGTWSAPFKTVIFVKGAFTTTKSVKVTQAEYFFDTDPGEGNASQLQVLDGEYNDALEKAFEFNIPSLSVGSHVLHVRALGEDGTWSSTFKTVIAVNDRNSIVLGRLLLTEAEYFFGTDPGEGSGDRMLVSDGKWDEAIEMVEADITSEALTVGSHLLNVRVKDRTGEWSSPFKTVINVQPKLTATPLAGQIQGNLNFCNGESLFGVQYTTLVDENYTYEWIVEGGQILQETATSSSIVVAWTSSASNHQVKLLTCDGTDNCADTVIKEVVIGTKPSFEITAETPYLCEDQNMTLSVTGVTGEATYCWLKDGFETGTSTSTMEVYTADLYGVVINQNGCETLKTIEIESEAAPSTQVIIFGKKEFCEDGTVRLMAPSSDQVSYSWFKGATDLEVTSNELIVSEAGDYTLKAMNNACTSISELETINVIALGSATVNSNTGAFSICSGNDIEISVDETVGVSYQWFKDAEAINLGMTNTLAVNSGASYALQFVNSYCSRFVDNIEVIETETPAPVITSEGLLFFCDNDSVKLNANVESEVDYQWTLNAFDLTSKTDPTSFYAREAGDYQLRANRNGCVATSNTLSALVQPSPEIPEISAISDDQLTSTSANSYAWYFEDELILDATLQALTIDEEGAYTVKIGDVNNFCFATSASFIVDFNIVSLGEEMIDKDLILYPTITSSTISFNKIISTIKIVNVKGKIVFEGSLEADSFDVSQFPAGEYLVLSPTEAARFIKL